MRCFVRDVRRQAAAADDFETAVCWNVAVPARGPRRRSRPARSTTTTCCGTLGVPLLVTHGRADTVVLPAMAEHVLATCPTAEASWYDGVGHVPHVEAPERFNEELARLAQRA